MRWTRWLRTGLLLGLCLGAGVSHAADPAADPADTAIRARFAESFPDVVINGITAIAAPGWYMVQAVGMAPVYVSADGQYMIQGDFVHFQGQRMVDLGDQALGHAAHALLTQAPSHDEIIFPAVGKTRAVVYAFTDVDCGYCRKFHTQIQAINARGIEVRYLAWPRTGTHGMTARKMATVWCAQDVQAALTHTMAGASLPQGGSACDGIIQRDYALGERLGVDGTPALFDVAGHKIGGYLSVADLEQALGLARH